MKLYRISFVLLLGLGMMTSCDDKLDVSNPNQQTTSTFGNTADDLEENVIAAYNHIRMEGCMDLEVIILSEVSLAEKTDI